MCMKKTTLCPLLLLLGLVGCAGKSLPDPAATFGEQVTRGMALFVEHCSNCHGSDGMGTDRAPPVVGSQALPLDPPPGAEVRNVQFRTALDVFQWVRVNMPGDAPASLEDQEYVEILAFDLKANGVELPQPLDATNANDVVLHP